MPNPRLAARYAKSLLDLAVERNVLEETLSDIKLLDNVCLQSTEFASIMKSPVIAGQKKLDIINAVSRDKMSELTRRFVQLLVTKGRELNIPEIVTAFIEQYNVLKNIKTVKVTTAVAMADNTRDAIHSRVAGFFPGATINLKTAIDKDLIGGFVLEAEDKLFDASIRKKLNDIKTGIIDSSYTARM
jgi:F-type H+-transporting ATPase subunit delta